MAMILDRFTKNSMMRFSLLIVMIVYILLNSVVMAYIIIAVCLGNAIEWYGLATFVGSVSFNLLSALGIKAYQKKYEKDEKQVNGITERAMA